MQAHMLVGVFVFTAAIFVGFAGVPAPGVADEYDEVLKSCEQSLAEAGEIVSSVGKTGRRAASTSSLTEYERTQEGVRDLMSAAEEKCRQVIQNCEAELGAFPAVVGPDEESERTKQRTGLRLNLIQAKLMLAMQARLAGELAFDDGFRRIRRYAAAAARFAGVAEEHRARLAGLYAAAKAAECYRLAGMTEQARESLEPLFDLPDDVPQFALLRLKAMAERAEMGDATRDGAFLADARARLRQAPRAERESGDFARLAIRVADAIRRLPGATSEDLAEAQRWAREAIRVFGGHQAEAVSVILEITPRVKQEDAARQLTPYPADFDEALAALEIVFRQYRDDAAAAQRWWQRIQRLQQGEKTDVAGLTPATALKALRRIQKRQRHLLADARRILEAAEPPADVRDDRFLQWEYYRAYALFGGGDAKQAKRIAEGVAAQAGRPRLAEAAQALSDEIDAAALKP